MAEKKTKKQTPAEAKAEIMSQLSDTKLASYHSTGFLTVDKLLGGGIPSNGTVFFYGLPDSGKTSFLYIMMAQAIREGKKICYVVTEKWDKRYLLNALGLPYDIDEKELREYIWIKDTNEAETAIKFMTKVAAYRMVDMIVLDSISAFVPSDMMLEPSDGSFGAAALLNNKLLKRLPKICAVQDIAFVFTGQVRVDMSNPIATYTLYTVPGGMLAMKHASSIIIQTKRAETVGVKLDGDEEPGEEKDGEKKKKAPSIKLAYAMDMNVMASRSVGCYGNTSAHPVVLVTDSTPRPDYGDEILEIGDLYGVFSDKDDNPLIGKVNALSIRKYNGRILGNRAAARNVINGDPELLDELYRVVQSAIVNGNSATVIGIPTSSFDEAEIDEDEL